MGVTGTPRARPFSHRFEKFVEFELNSGCWLWSGAIDGVGRYGQTSVNGRQVGAHCASFEAFVRPLVAGEIVCHRCDTPQCINPAHLFAGTHKDNTADMWRKGRANRPPLLVGENNPKSKLTATDVHEIRRAYEPPGPGRQRVKRGLMKGLAQKYGVREAIIYRIIRGQIWRSV